jgi:hypothetical protein
VKTKKPDTKIKAFETIHGSKEKGNTPYHDERVPSVSAPPSGRDPMRTNRTISTQTSVYYTPRSYTSFVVSPRRIEDLPETVEKSPQKTESQKPKNQETSDQQLERSVSYREKPGKSEEDSDTLKHSKSFFTPPRRKNTGSLWRLRRHESAFSSESLTSVCIGEVFDQSIISQLEDVGEENVKSSNV